MRNSHVKTASFDIRYGDPDRNPLKQDHMDLCTSAGFSFLILMFRKGLLYPVLLISFHGCFPLAWTSLLK